MDEPYKHTGQEYEYSLEFYFYEYRYYDPFFGRFVSPNTIVPNPLNSQDLNRYSYVRNSPLTYTDPTVKGNHVIERADGTLVMPEIFDELLWPIACAALRRGDALL